MMDVYEINRGSMRKLPDCRELRWWCTHLFFFVAGIILALYWIGGQG